MSSDFLHSIFTQCFVYYTLKLQVGTELCIDRSVLIFVLIEVLIAWKSFDCPIVSLNKVFLYDTPLKLTLDHAQWVFIVIL